MNKKEIKQKAPKVEASKMRQIIIETDGTKMNLVKAEVAVGEVVPKYFLAL